MNIPQGLRYTKEHEWAGLNGNIVTIGITDYAQGELGDIVFIELPEIGASVEAGSAFGTIEAVKAVADLFAPMSGEIVEINTALEDTPELINQSPYDDGWMVKVKVTDTSEFGKLMDADAYRQMLEG